LEEKKRSTPRKSFYCFLSAKLTIFSAKYEFFLSTFAQGGTLTFCQFLKIKLDIHSTIDFTNEQRELYQESGSNLKSRIPVYIFRQLKAALHNNQRRACIMPWL
jgi:hypothetical protein